MISNLPPLSPPDNDGHQKTKDRGPYLASSLRPSILYSCRRVLKEHNLLQICLDSVAAAIVAEQSGADRVELCDNMLEGGTTPSAEVATSATQTTSSKSCARISMPPNRLALTASPSASFVRMAPSTKIGRALTFHRAFDVTVNPYEALEDLISIGVDRILTSGQDSSAWEGIDLIAELIEKAANRIIIMPGSGMTACLFGFMFNLVLFEERDLYDPHAPPSNCAARMSMVHNHLQESPSATSRRLSTAFTRRRSTSPARSLSRAPW
ncbi:copper homeostasis CutC domain-containing protein [Jimgerdemannia flammicorona]|uniref:Copper homeostasis protein cutC homolog n=2 Tax=Jimgerdemannia flammicorona TaxID=994334 RepID=A0A433D2Y2_9FUNG|nr:copper homeostasis CutC domain-containing protein [Jimgerdemannia flammicorona]RUS27495.1 copper homeostasis CutC domain-containing protein [Jimgerdemannia flammicorona]